MKSPESCFTTATPSRSPSFSPSPSATASATATPVVSATTTPSISPTAIATPHPPDLTVGPNPFAPALPPADRVRFGLPRTGRGELLIFDLERRRVRRLDWDARASVEWDGSGDAGQALPGGVYVYLLRHEGRVWRGTLTLVR